MKQEAESPMSRIRVYKSKWFQRFAGKQSIEDSALLEAVDRAERGLVDADLGGGVLKQRVARQGQGKSSGYRTILLYRQGARAVFMYGFAKSDRDNIDDDEVKSFKDAATHVLGLTKEQMAELVEKGEFVEVMRNEQEEVPK